MNGTMLWLVLILDNVRVVAIVLLTIFGIVGLMFMPFLCDDDFGCKSFIAGHVKSIVAAFVVLIFVVTLCPSTKQAAVIWLVPQVVESRAIQQDMPQLYGLAVEWAKEKLGAGVEQ